MASLTNTNLLDRLMGVGQASPQPAASPYANNPTAPTIANAAKITAAQSVSAPQSVSTPQATYGASAPTSNGFTGVRQQGVNLGIKNEDIRWNNNNGTYSFDGNNWYKPQSEVNGTSYDTLDNIQKAAIQARANTDNPLVAATAAAAGNGTVPISPQWIGGVAYLNGIPLPNAFQTSDGKTIVDNNTLQSALKQIQAQTGLRNPNDIVKQQNDRYGGSYEEMLDRLMNPDDITTTPQWQAYSDAYLREGNRAMENTMAGMAGMTGGFVNSAALSAGAQQRNYYNSQLMDKYPELQQAIYNQNRSTLDAIMGVDNHQFGREYGVNTDIYNRVMEQNALDTERDRYNQQWNRQSQFDAYNLAMAGNALTRDYVDTAGYSEMYDIKKKAIIQEYEKGNLTIQEMQMLLDALPEQLQRQAESERLINEGKAMENKYAASLYA